MALIDASVSSGLKQSFKFILPQFQWIRAIYQASSRRLFLVPYLNLGGSLAVYDYAYDLKSFTP